jgi:hypothetical protein
MRFRSLLPRFLIGLVAFLNLQCAFLFIFRPQDHLPGFELSGVPGLTAVQGMGLLFVMWNIPYLIALLDPVRQQTSLQAALWMQAVGLFGEIWILFGIPGENAVLRGSITRFIAFDFGGLLLLGWAAVLVHRLKLKNASNNQIIGMQIR